ncbi:unnamed protein product, partial [Didymodactylos carnosus]
MNHPSIHDEDCTYQRVDKYLSQRLESASNTETISFFLQIFDVNIVLRDQYILIVSRLSEDKVGALEKIIQIRIAKAFVQNCRIWGPPYPPALMDDNESVQMQNMSMNANDRSILYKILEQLDLKQNAAKACDFLLTMSKPLSLTLDSSV